MSIRILVLDAEPVVREVVSRILTRHGYEVEATANFADAVLMARNTPPDLLITNLMLPGIRGCDAAKTMVDLHPGLRVLMVSGLPDDEETHKMTAAHGIETFPKPFGANDLAAKVKEILEK